MAEWGKESMTIRPHPGADLPGLRAVGGQARRAPARGDALGSTLPPGERGGTRQAQGTDPAPARPAPLPGGAPLLCRPGPPAVPEAGVSRGVQTAARVPGTFLSLCRPETGP